MANTGNIIIVEQDTNPNSATYNTTRIRTVQDYIECIPDGMKLYYKTENGSGSLQCNSDYALTGTETSSFRSSIVEASVGNCVSAIGYQAFNIISANMPLSSYKLTKVVLPDTITNISGYAFACNRNLTDINLPPALAKIGDHAFYYCDHLTEITIPASVTTISSFAFSQCNGLVSITCLPTTPPTLGTSNPFENSSGWIYVPAESLNAYKKADKWKDIKSRIKAIGSE